VTEGESRHDLAIRASIIASAFRYAMPEDTLMPGERKCLCPSHAIRGRSLIERSAYLKGFVAILLWSVLVGSALHAFGQTATLQGAWRQKAFDGIFSDDRASPKIDNGYLLSFRRTRTDSSNEADILLQSLAGGERRQLSFWPERVSVVWFADVSATLSKHLIVVGSFLRSDEAGPRNFVSEVDFEGHTLNTVDLGTFEPELACSANDGSFWVLGQDWDAEKSGAAYELLRNYAPDWRLIRSALNRKDLPYRVNLSARLHYAGGGTGRAFLVCGEKSVGVYIGPAITWAEVSFSDGGQTTWRVKLPPPRARITGFALLGEQVYSSFYTVFKDNSNPQQGLYKLNSSQPSSAVWEPIDGTIAAYGSNRSFSTLIGGDSGSLVYVRSGMVEAGEAPILFWSKPSF
jgi:hypothetical protein